MKKIALLAVLFLIAGISFGLYQYNRAPANLKNEKAEIMLSATELKEQFAADTSTRNRYSNKVILVEGKVSSVEQGEHTTITLDASVRGELDKNTAVPQLGQTIQLKGLLGGYDEMFEEVVLIKCELEE